MQEAAQSTRHQLLICPASFAANVQTAASNAFQLAAAGRPASELALQARTELERLARCLRDAGAEPLVFDDLPGGPSPDAVFPNNWVSFHADGTVILYPLLAPNRRVERRRDIVDRLREAGFGVSRIVDLSEFEQRQWYLEGTGSLVLDRLSGTAYAALSPRTSTAALERFSALTGYRIQRFSSADPRGMPVYHTNVIMSIGTGYAVVCGEAIAVARERAAVCAGLEDSGREIVSIDMGQMLRFAGNCLEVATPAGPLVVLSEGACASLSARQRTALERHARLLPVAVPVIERSGGGSVRCMLAEIHLPQIASPGEAP